MSMERIGIWPSELEYGYYKLVSLNPVIVSLRLARRSFVLVVVRFIRAIMSRMIVQVSLNTI